MSNDAENSFIKLFHRITVNKEHKRQKKQLLTGTLHDFDRYST